MMHAISELTGMHVRWMTRVEISASQQWKHEQQKQNPTWKRDSWSKNPPLRAITHDRDIPQNMAIEASMCRQREVFQSTKALPASSKFACTKQRSKSGNSKEFIRGCHAWVMEDIPGHRSLTHFIRICLHKTISKKWQDNAVHKNQIRWMCSKQVQKVCQEVFRELCRKKIHKVLWKQVSNVP